MNIENRITTQKDTFSVSGGEIQHLQKYAMTLRRRAINISAKPVCQPVAIPDMEDNDTSVIRGPAT